MKRRMHKNSLKAYASLKLEWKEELPLMSYRTGRRLTDRTVQEQFHLSRIQPRITSLLKKKMLKECDSVKCQVSGRTVRTCKITALGRKALKK